MLPSVARKALLSSSSRRFSEASKCLGTLPNVLELRARLSKHSERAEVHHVLHEARKGLLAYGEHSRLGVNECRETFQFDLLLLDSDAKLGDLGFEVRLASSEEDRQNGSHEAHDGSSIGAIQTKATVCKRAVEAR